MRRGVKIGAKLAFALGLMLLLFILAILLSIGTNRDTTSLTTGFFEHEFLTTTHAHTISNAIDRVTQILLSATAREEALSLEDRETADALFDSINQSIAAISDAYRGDPAPIRKIVSAYGVMKESASRIIGALNTAAVDKALALYEGRYAPAVDAIERESNALYALAEQIAQEDAVQIRSNSQTLTIAALFLTVVIGSFSLMMSVMIIRSVTWPVAELKMASEEIARGNLSVQFDVQTTDELGDLAASLRGTIGTLSVYIGETQRALVALGEGDLSYRAPDIFMGDFVAIRDSIDTIAALLEERKERDEKSRAELELAYQAADRASRAKSDFLSRMSHDMRTPLNGIIGMTTIAASDLSDHEKVASSLRKALFSSRHLLGLINDVLDMSKIESGNMTLTDEDISLPSQIESLLTIAQPQIQTRRQSFFIRLHDVRHENLRCDGLRLNQIFLNILGNAIKFTPEGGTLSLDITELPEETPGIACFSFRFADTGIGMKPEFLRNIFASFSREQDSMVDKIEGSGLGMSITKSIVDLMGGTIDVQSEEGKGSVFTVGLRFPLSEGQAETPDPLPPLRALVVEEDSASRESLVQNLRAEGIQAEGCPPDTAVSIAGAALDEKNPYDAILVDCALPDTEWIDIVRALRSRLGPDAVLLYISAYDLNLLKEQAKAAGGSGFIPKPLFPSTIRECFAQHVLGDANDKRSAGEEESYDFTGKHVLIVEDNEINQIIATEIISSTGATTDLADNGAEALELFERSPEGGYDLILMDIQMPVMGGYEATRRIRALSREDARRIPIFALTANAFSDDIAAAREAGMDYHLAKPLDVQQIMRKMKEYLG